LGVGRGRGRHGGRHGGRGRGVTGASGVCGECVGIGGLHQKWGKVSSTPGSPLILAEPPETGRMETFPRDWGRRCVGVALS
jgi:hypothetical protein